MSGGWGTPSWMGGEVALGDTFVSEKTPEVARDLLAAAADLGVDVVEVRTVTNGFIVPTEVYEQAVNSRAEREGRSF